MKSLALIFLALIAPIGASSAQELSHHRGHVEHFLGQSLDTFDDALYWAKKYRDKDVAVLLPPDQKAEYDALKGNAEAIAGWNSQKRSTYPADQYPEWNVIYYHIFHSNKFIIYGEKYRNRVIKYREAMLAGAPLSDTRDLIHSSGFNGELESGIWGFIQVIPNITMCATDDSPNLATVRRVLLMTRNAAGTLTWALWHHYDATFDEVYSDPEFQ